MRSTRIYGKGRETYNNVRIGLEARMDTFQAAILVEKLKMFPEEIELRQGVASAYVKRLKEALSDLKIQTIQYVSETVKAIATRESELYQRVSSE